MTTVLTFLGKHCVTALLYDPGINSFFCIYPQVIATLALSIAMHPISLSSLPSVGRVYLCTLFLIFEEQDLVQARKAECGKNNDKSSLNKCGKPYLAQASPRLQP